MRILLPNKRPASSDTYIRDHLDEIMNDITRKYYGFILVTCPKCATINACYDETHDSLHVCSNGSCAHQFHPSDAPDLFF